MMHQKLSVVYKVGAEGGGYSLEQKERYFTKFASFYLKLGVNF